MALLQHRLVLLLFSSIPATIHTVRPTYTSSSNQVDLRLQSESRQRQKTPGVFRSGPISALSIRTIQCFLLEKAPLRHLLYLHEYVTLLRITKHIVICCRKLSVSIVNWKLNNYWRSDERMKLQSFFLPTNYYQTQVVIIKHLEIHKSRVSCAVFKEV